jgi:hypothetical protein
MGDPCEMPLLSGWVRARLGALPCGLDDCRATCSFLLSRASAGDTANAVMSTVMATAAVVRAEMTRLCRITGWSSWESPTHWAYYGALRRRLPRGRQGGGATKARPPGTGHAAEEKHVPAI